MFRFILRSAASARQLSLQFKVQPNVTGLTAVVYIGQVTLYFSDNTVGSVAVLFIVTSGSGGASGELIVRDALCRRRALPRNVACFHAARMGVGRRSSLADASGRQYRRRLRELHDIGKRHRVFLSGDRAISLLSVGNRTWTATWQRQVSATEATITVLAEEDRPFVEGIASAGGSLEANSTTPATSAGGALARSVT